MLLCIFLHSLFYFCFEVHFLFSNLHLPSREICFTSDFNSLNPLVILNTIKLTPFVLFGTHNLPDKLLKVSLLSLHLSNSTAN